MAVKIKLKRLGKIRAPYYRIVVADARTKRDGRAIEEIGKYHPKLDPSLIEVNSERAQYWLSVGAQPTEPVQRLLEITGDWQKFRGLPGAEGTLRTAEARPDKKQAFAAAVAETIKDAEADKGKGKASGQRADKSKAAQSKSDRPKADKGKDAAAAQATEPVSAEAEEAKSAKGKADKADTAKASKPKTAESKTEEPQAAESKNAGRASKAAAESAPGQESGA